MTMATEYELVGLEPDNLLAFLALLGLLRALETAQPEWRPCAEWRGSPPSAFLKVRNEATYDQIVAEADTGTKQIGRSYRAALDSKDNLKFTADEFRQLAEKIRANRSESQIVCSLASDGAIKKNSKEVEPTAFCVMFGSGRQCFLDRLRSVPCEGSKDDIRSALFEPWAYVDATPSFRWDPIEDRRYALQYGNPSDDKNKIKTVTGANRLAAAGFGVLVSAPAARGLVTLGIAETDKRKRACWPLVAVPTSLAAYLALLAHPQLAKESKSRVLKAYGVSAIARADRFQNDKYFNFARARIQFLT